MNRNINRRPHTTRNKNVKRRYERKHREKNFVLDCKTAIKDDYEPFQD